LITGTVFVSVANVTSIARRLGTATALATMTLCVTACATSPPATTPSGRIRVVAAENMWGNLAAQLGGDRAQVTSIITNPATDPHDYEPSAPDAIKLSGAQLAIVNGVGYDSWATKIVSADENRGQTVLNVGDLVGVSAGGNPHRWYSPTDVRTVIDRITANLSRIDPAHATYFAERRDFVLNTALKQYFGLIDQIRSQYAGTPVGASESIFVPLAAATGLDLITPSDLLNAVSEGGEPTAADKATADAQLTDHRIRVFVYNSQNATPDVQRQVLAARAAGIPVTTITETLSPAGASFQQWQVAQLVALRQALATSVRSSTGTTGK
jgi:zinc/manganese transport system substrate-binding protein